MIILQAHLTGMDRLIANQPHAVERLLHYRMKPIGHKIANGVIKLPFLRQVLTQPLNS